MSKERLTADKQREWIINTILSIARNPEGYRISELKEKFNIVLIEYAEAFARQEVEAAIAETKKQRDELLTACQKAFSVIVALTTDMNAPIIKDIEAAITNAQTE
jgi:hypothetical protein